MSTPNSIQDPTGDLVDPPLETSLFDMILTQPGSHLMQPFHPQLYDGARQPSTKPDEWMPGRPVPFNPPGLEYLTQIDQILVQQKVECCEVLTGCEMRNRYHIKNIMGQKIFNAIEDTTFCTRFCCGTIRPFNMKIIDSEGQEVMHLYRPLKCQDCCFPCCLQSMQVTASGIVCGYIKQTWSLCKPKFKVCDSSGETIFRIKGPFCIFSCCRDVKFKVLTRDGESEVGCITKQWSGLARELFTDADHFGISFPMDLDVKIKALLLGACFLIDFMYFEDPN
ncbi:phospholipid scramblase 1-like [Tetranychus urticae]|uniref:phospholipid scramblase 1-like n=1 Tax=Tetranychus urticae TaxID=32264 RepID=UPI000356241D|nr:phospholipid scramblase 1-like [Tetranychus urticae]